MPDDDEIRQLGRWMQRASVEGHDVRTIQLKDAIAICGILVSIIVGLVAHIWTRETVLQRVGTLVEREINQVTREYQRWNLEVLTELRRRIDKLEARDRLEGR